MDLWIREEEQGQSSGLDHVPCDGVEVRNRYQELNHEGDEEDGEIDMGFMGLV